MGGASQSINNLLRAYVNCVTSGGAVESRQAEATYRMRKKNARQHSAVNSSDWPSRDRTRQRGFLTYSASAGRH